MAINQFQQDYISRMSYSNVSLSWAPNQFLKLLALSEAGTSVSGDVISLHGLEF